MNRNSGEISVNIFALVAGIVLIVLHNELQLLNYIAMLVGLVIILPSAFMIYSFFKTRNELMPSAGGIMALIFSIMAATLGVVMVAKPIIFVGLLTYLLAALLIISGLYHIIYLAASSKIYKFPVWYYILPSLILVAGIVIMVTDLAKIQAVVVLVTGIALVLFAVHSVIASFVLRRIVKIANKQ